MCAAAAPMHTAWPCPTSRGDSGGSGASPPHGRGEARSAVSKLIAVLSAHDAFECPSIQKVVRAGKDDEEEAEEEATGRAPCQAVNARRSCCRRGRSMSTSAARRAARRGANGTSRARLAPREAMAVAHPSSVRGGGCCASRQCLTCRAPSQSSSGMRSIPDLAPGSHRTCLHAPRRAAALIAQPPEDRPGAQQSTLAPPSSNAAASARGARRRPSPAPPPHRRRRRRSPPPPSRRAPPADVDLDRVRQPCRGPVTAGREDELTLASSSAAPPGGGAVDALAAFCWPPRRRPWRRVPPSEPASCLAAPQYSQQSDAAATGGDVGGASAAGVSARTPSPTDAAVWAAHAPLGEYDHGRWLRSVVVPLLRHAANNGILAACRPRRGGVAASPRASSGPC